MQARVSVLSGLGGFQACSPGNGLWVHHSIYSIILFNKERRINVVAITSST